jgi:putative lipase involved disintegration of autophagic bodies
MLLVLIIIVSYFLLFMVAEVIKDTYTKAKDRSDERIMAAYLAAEDAHYHRQRLEAIDRTVQATSEEMMRIATEARGEVIEGTAVEVTRR